MERLKTFKGLKAGTKIKVVSNSNSHSYPMDTELTLKKAVMSVSGSDMVTEVVGNTLRATDCILSSTTVEDLEKRLTELEKEKKDIQAKIKFCKEAEIEEYDENLFKVYKTLELVDNATLDRKKKAALISKLISS